ncbi:L-glyceraldehyde 3-phosphate reductase [Sediminihabitans luteus]|uniref:L-glyceraldehyde 3-phosphate reductase n=1 Tax=Sediminihabitans luteus TaxID=1138585 RepID=A0A2M9CZN4_9CELL|nr:aldo/keto reductase [Sediminihabitans luteus]PJJ77401.1 L-glyceraldehyde 3-phosphate reductase [Sediminihabitans luteus]GII98294.1 glyceraldehyde 3-phosphate reductase [Sediminihabitans luteus]
MPATPYLAAEDRYESMTYRRCGRSGLDLPALSLGLWHNFGDVDPFENQRATLRRAFDLGVTHIDLANNYGPPYGSAEENFGRHLAKDFAPYRDEMVISSKAGYDMWPGPYGDFGSRKYLTASLDQSLQRMGLDYVDIFYHHRPDPATPLEETMGALHSIVQQGKALYVGVSNYSPARTREAHRILADLGTPLTIHQPSYSMFNRHVEDPAHHDGYDGPQSESLLDVAGDLGVGVITFSPLQQGLLTDRYLSGSAPEGSRAARSSSPFLSGDNLSGEYLERARALNEIAAGRGQSLAQLALAWLLRDGRVTSALVGASSARQLENSVRALEAPPLTDDEIAAIEPFAVDGTGRR